MLERFRSRRFVQAANGFMPDAAIGTGARSISLGANSFVQRPLDSGDKARLSELLIRSTAPGTDLPARIELLPELPAQWVSGSASGLWARGDFEVRIRWNDGTLAEVVVANLASRRASVDVVYAQRTVRLTIDGGVSQTLGGSLSKAALTRR